MWWTRRWALALAGLAAAVVATTVVAAWSIRDAALREKAVATLSSELGLDVTLDELSFALFPTPGLSGRGLVLRVPERPDLPPFIVVHEFRVDAGVRNVLAGHFRLARLDGLEITIPPGDDKRELARATDSASSEDTRGADWSKRIIFDRIETPNAELTILRQKQGDAPLVFEIHELTLTDVGFDREIPFHTTLTNPIPNGLVASTGRLGPFPRGTPNALPIAGDYTFTGANLDTIKGIAGTLTSTGKYEGVISQIAVTGESQTPDFSLDLGGHPLPLTATFDVVVDGTNGTTELRRVDARLLNTNIFVTGLIENLPGPGNRSVALEATIDDGRLEDLLRLVVDSESPGFSGQVTLRADIGIPPGPARVRERLQVNGRFELATARFTQPQVRAKVIELSRRSQGKRSDEAAPEVFSNVRSGFALERGVLSISQLTFEVPGAAVRLAGRYDTGSGHLDFQGDLRMQAPVSRVIGGWKGALLKPFDFLFREKGAGAVIPIRVTGTRTAPEINIRIGSVLKRGFGGG